MLSLARSLPRPKLALPVGAILTGALLLVCLLSGSNAVRAGSPDVDAYSQLSGASCGLAWRSVEPPPVGEDSLRDIAAVSSNDVWVVGSTVFVPDSQTLIEHWDGSAWSVVPSPNSSDNYNILASVDIAAPNDIWAVGYSLDTTTGHGRALFLHWDGASWSIVPSPDPGPSVYPILYSVDVISSNDVWAVGSLPASTGPSAENLAMHWDGVAWTVVATPDGALSGNIMQAVSGVATDDVWAVGYSSDSSDSEAFAMHWDGASWTMAPLPPLGSHTTLLDVAAVATDDAWAIGSYIDTSYHGVLIHWDGIAWSVFDAPDNFPMRLAVVAPDDVWSIGPGPFITAARWNGYEWGAAPGPSIPNPVISLGLTAVSADELWAVGSWAIGRHMYGWMSHYSDLTVAYADVPEETEFFPYIKCLSCEGIIRGYSCGGPGEPCNANNDPYFRPGISVTRGQLAKIVAGAADSSESPDAPTFEDVPPGSTFYTYVESLAFAEVMSGYPCGGSDEPCVPPDNRPYFRPSATASRGQLAKITSNAAGFTDPVPAGTQTFADVPEGSTFHVYIERLAMRDVMQGYPCGGPGEPCDPLNRPYFRPGNTVTRGQTTKIVSNTFFPDCQPPNRR